VVVSSISYLQYSLENSKQETMISTIHKGGEVNYLKWVLIGKLLTLPYIPQVSTPALIACSSERHLVHTKMASIIRIN
jgi:hypothetical protein